MDHLNLEVKSKQQYRMEGQMELFDSGNYQNVALVSVSLFWYRDHH